MKDKGNISPATSPDLQLAFDVGHSSIGWAVLQSLGRASSGGEAPTVNILGCGVVTFRADDCLASARRGYRRQRRHIRSTRQRIARMKILLAHLGVLKPEQLDLPGCAWPWLLAARVLRGGQLLTWPELWDVLRWYAQNRGYDGNRRWSAAEAEAAEEDTEKEETAKNLMAIHRVDTMAETFCKISGLDPLGAKKSCHLPGDKRPKGQNAAFPRTIVENEVRRILKAHFGRLTKVDEQLERVLLGRDNQDKTAWQAIPCPELKLPRRYQGALLFGQLVPRFDNRIIAHCPVTFAEEYRRLLALGRSEKDAKRFADVAAKVPAKNCLEFLNFRWALTLSNIRIGFDGETYGNNEELRPLTLTERIKVDASVRRLGFLKLEKDKPDNAGFIRAGKNELREILFSETKCSRHNLETLLLHPDAKESLKLLHVEGDTAAFRVGWSALDGPSHDQNGLYHDSVYRNRFGIQLLRQKKLSLSEMIKQLEKIGDSEMANRIRFAVRKEASDKRGNINEEKLAKLMDAEFFCQKLRGRARFSRQKLRQAFQQTFQKDKPIHPFERGGCLEQTEDVKQAATHRELAEQTNNHLIRHRLKILVGDRKAKRKRKPGEAKPGLLQDIIEEFAGGEKSRIGRITVELARDLQDMSGMSNQEKKKALGAKLAHHKHISEELAEKLRDANGSPLRDPSGRPLFASPGLIRKARILEDLEMQCPYTGHPIDYINLLEPHAQFGTVDKDHVIPRSQRLSDALEAQVITFSEINRIKNARSALQFVRDMNLPESRHHKERFGIRTEAQFRGFVDALWPKTDPFRRARAGGAKATDDEARCWRRKEFLLKASWDGKEFTPADLTQTRHIVKLAAQQLEAEFSEFPTEQRPPVIVINGAVTAVFRDKTWKLLGELAAVHPLVKQVLVQGVKDQEQGKDFNPKKAIRELSHLHHAVDALALGFIADLIVPPGHRSLNGELARLIVKGKLAVNKEKGIDELSSFRNLCANLRLAHFAGIDNQNRLHVDDLSISIKEQIRRRLSERRVVQHVPADMRALECDETVYHVFDPHDTTPNAKRLKRWFDELLDAGQLKKLTALPDPKNEKEPMVLLTARKRRSQPGGESGKTLHDTGNEWRWIYLLTGKDSVHGLNPTGNRRGKLSAIKAVKVLGENFGVVAINEGEGEQRFEMLRPRKVFTELKKIRQLNPRARLQIIRKGTIIRLTESNGSQTWLRIFGCGERPGRGIYFDAGAPDAIEREREIQISAFENGRAQIIQTTLTGISGCPTTSSA